MQLARTAGTPPVTGEYMIGPDGNGPTCANTARLHVAGKTITEIRQDLNRLLGQFFDSPQVSVEVRQYNSKVFYVITEGAGLGDNVRRIPTTGNDTVLDALSAVDGLSQVSSAGDVGGASGARRVGLRADSAGRLPRDRPRRLDRDELSN